MARHVIQAVAAIVCASGLMPAACAAEGRWEGQAQVPGVAVPVVLDLARAATGDGWIGSITLPGRGLRGVPLKSLAVQGNVVRGQTAAAAGSPPGSELAVDLRHSTAQTLVGELRQGGHAAALTLTRTRPALVEQPPVGTPIAPGLRGTWIGRFDIGYGARDVTLKLDAAADGSAPKATMTVIGRRTYDLTVDLIEQRGAWVTLSLAEPAISLDGPWALEGEQWKLTWRQGPFESPLVLRRAR